MKSWIFIFMISLSASFAYAKPYNQVIAQVGQYSITGYDLSQTLLFEQTMGKTNLTKKKVFEDILMTYGIFDLAAQNEKYQVSDADINKTIESLTNANDKESESVVRERQQIYSKFPEALRMQIKKNRIMQTLFFYDEDLKAKVNEAPSEESMKKFYKQNSRLFMKLPKIDIAVFVVKKKESWSFDYLEKVEGAMRKIASLLKKGVSAEKIIKKYSWLHFESYSGRSGLKDLRELNTEKYPQELILLPLQKTMLLPEMKNIKGVPTFTGKQVKQKVKPGFVFYIGQPMPLRGKKGLYYVALKVMQRVEPDVLPYKAVKDKIMAELKNQNAVDILKEKIKEEFQKKEIFVSILDPSYQGVYDEFIRR